MDKKKKSIKIELSSCVLYEEKLLKGFLTIIRIKGTGFPGVLPQFNLRVYTGIRYAISFRAISYIGTRGDDEDWKSADINSYIGRVPEPLA